MSIRQRVADKQHRWLSQVDLTGVVLSEPVLAEAAPGGFRNLEKRELAQFYRAREVWNLPPGMAGGDPAARWVEFVVGELLGLGTSRWQVGAGIAPRFVVTLSQQRETLRPTKVLLDGTDAVLLLLVVPRTQSLDSPWDTGGSWKASPTTKVERLLRESGVEIGLITNGEAWRLVVASPSETAAWLTWTVQTWADSPSTLAAFVDLLGETRFFAGPRSGTILELVRASRERQADVADQLGTQVRQALELFVRELDRIDASLEGDLLSPYTDDEVFEAAASLLMRMVFLLKAEESGLLPHGSIQYDRSYGVLHLLARLERAHRLAPEKLRQSSEGYSQLLGTFRLVHDGSPDPDINVVAYGGELFDPDKYPVLEGRTRDGRWLDGRRAKPLSIRDSVLREMLRRLKYTRGVSGAVQWVSYRTLEIEQLGHMYEGLLDLRLRRAPDESSLLLLTPTDKVPSPVIATNELVGQSSKDVCAALARVTGRTLVEIAAAMKRGTEDAGRESRLPDGLPQEFGSIARFIRAEGIVRPAGLYVDFGNRRHDQGAVYTPTTITEPMIRRALEPLVVHRQTDQTSRPKTARELLSLRVCDPAMGSAAFLVQAVRFLAERLVDAWDAASISTEDAPLTMPYASGAAGLHGELLMPETREERVLWARRFVAERCVYGVDINPLAVEMAKLSLWLATAAPTKPFTFLDHVLRSGNAVIGADLQQVRTWSLNRKGDKQPLFASLLEGTVTDAVEARHRLTRLTGRATETEKRSALRSATAATARLSIAADLLVASWLTPADDRARISKTSASLIAVTAARTDADWEALARMARNELGDVRPFHWPCEFPDVFLEGKGFDAVVGNPPYVRQETLGPIKPILKQAFDVFDGTADLYVYFYELGLRILKPGGRLSLIVTNKWMKSGYGERLREQFALNAWVDSIIDFGHARQLFKDVDVFPSIIIVTKPDDHTVAPTVTRVCVIDRRQLRIDDLDNHIRRDGYDLPRSSLTSEPWLLESPDVVRLLETLERVGRPLAKCVGGPPYRGVVTGLNEAFVVNRETKDALIAEHAGAAELLRPLTRGRDVKRWLPEPSQQWLIFARRGVDIGAYPALERHLAKFRGQLEPKPKDWTGKNWPGRKAGSYAWYEIQDSIDYWRAFLEPKIIYQDIQHAPAFALDRNGTITNNTVWILKTTDEYLLAVLNSAVYWWYAWRRFPHGKDDALRPFDDYLSKVPIAEPSPELRTSIVGAVDRVIRVTQESAVLWEHVLTATAHTFGTACAPAVTAGLRRGLDLRSALRKAGCEVGRDPLRDLEKVWQRDAEVIQQNNSSAKLLEREITSLVLDAFQLSEEEREVFWDTAPPRTPLLHDTENASQEDDEVSGPSESATIQ
jgi:hypothetical protein